MHALVIKEKKIAHHNIWNGYSKFNTIFYYLYIQNRKQMSDILIFTVISTDIHFFHLS